MTKYRNSIIFWAGVAVFLIAVLSMTQIVRNEYPFFAGYVILLWVYYTAQIFLLGAEFTKAYSDLRTGKPVEERKSSRADRPEGATA